MVTVAVVVLRLRLSASVELVRLYVLLYAASAIALASRINYTTRRMFLFHPPSLHLSLPGTVLPGCLARYVSCIVEEIVNTRLILLLISLFST